MTRTRLLYLFALLLPLVFIGVSCAYNVYFRAIAPTYTVVIKGYDPRDLLFGKYLQFRFDWNDPRSQKPVGKTVRDLPDSGRFYLPERAAPDLQSMIWQDKDARFTADVSLMGKKTVVRDLHINDQPWQKALDGWRARPLPAPCGPGVPGEMPVPGCAAH